MAVSFEDGIESFIINRTNINSAVCIDLIEMVKQHDSNFVLFADNATIHTSKQTNLYL